MILVKVNRKGKQHCYCFNNLLLGSFIPSEQRGATLGTFSCLFELHFHLLVLSKDIIKMKQESIMRNNIYKELM